MKKIDFPLWSDTVFFFACAFLVTLCILRYYRIAMWLALLLAGITALSLAVGVFSLNYLRRSKKHLLQRDREEQEKLMLHLALSSPEANRKLFAPLLEEQKREDGEEKVYFLFTMQPLSADAVAEKIKNSPAGETFRIFCNALTPEAARLCERFALPVSDGSEIYALLKERGLLPEKYICGETKKRGVRERVKIGCRKKNSRSFFVSGAALLILSLFSFFPLYYVIGGCVLIFTSVLVRIFGYA